MVSFSSEGHLKMAEYYHDRFQRCLRVVDWYADKFADFNDPFRIYSEEEIKQGIRVRAKIGEWQVRAEALRGFHRFHRGQAMIGGKK
ncbi:hypothetical protein AYI83_15910 [Shewanella algae]|nr:hypothetical protein AYI83_15910 [Shewanella algae]